MSNMLDLDWVWRHCNHFDWDGYGAEAVSEECFAVVREIMQRFPGLYRIAEVSPLSNGTFSFEWEADRNNWFNLEVGKERYSAYRQHHESDKVEYFPSPTATGPNADVYALLETHVMKFAQEYRLSDDLS